MSLLVLYICHRNNFRNVDCYRINYDTASQLWRRHAARWFKASEIDILDFKEKRIHVNTIWSLFFSLFDGFYLIFRFGIFNRVTI